MAAFAKIDYKATEVDQCVTDAGEKSCGSCCKKNTTNDSIAISNTAKCKAEQKHCEGECKQGQETAHQ